jgi:TRAP-type C4-dicarboxylate transport system permease small subunit
MELLKRIYKFIIIFFEEILSTAALIICALVIGIQVFYRYFLNISLEWPFELSIYAYIWTLYLGAAWGVREGHHVKFNILYDKLPLKVQKILNIVFNTITTAVFIIIFKPVWEYLLFNYRIKTVALKIPWTYVFIVFPIFLILTIIHNIEHIIRDITFLFNIKNTNETGDKLKCL